MQTVERGVSVELYKVLNIIFSQRASDPRTEVVHFQDASVNGTAVVCTVWFPLQFHEVSTIGR